MPSVASVEQKIFELEGVQVIFLLPKSAKIKDYQYSKPLEKGSYISDLEKRICDSITIGTDIQYTIKLGNGRNASPFKTIESCQESYR